jgi:hypothetical protein
MALINTTTTGVLGSTFFGDGTGSLTVQQNGVTLGIYGNIPAFSAYASGTTSLGNATSTLLAYATEFFDTASCYNNTGSTVGSIPAYSFLPNIAGYYQMNANHVIAYNGGSTNMALQFFKNGSQYHISSGASGVTNAYMNGSMLVYLNGTTDYVSVYAYWTGAGASTGSGVGYQFSGFLAKAA